jgi:hypothetical protein
LKFPATSCDDLGGSGDSTRSPLPQQKAPNPGGVGQDARASYGADEGVVFTDASDYAIAYAQVEQAFVTAAGQSSRVRFLESILCGETEALCVAALALGRDRKFVIDNQVLHAICRKGHSSNISVNRMLARTFGREFPDTEWCPTYLNVADPFTRGVPVPRCPTPMQDWVTGWTVLADGITYSSNAAFQAKYEFGRLREFASLVDNDLVLDLAPRV